MVIAEKFDNQQVSSISKEEAGHNESFSSFLAKSEIWWIASRHPGRFVCFILLAVGHITKTNCPRQKEKRAALVPFLSWLTVYLDDNKRHLSSNKSNDHFGRPCFSFSLSYFSIQQ